MLKMITRFILNILDSEITIILLILHVARGKCVAFSNSPTLDACYDTVIGRTPSPGTLKLKIDLLTSNGN